MVDASLKQEIADWVQEKVRAGYETAEEIAGRLPDMFTEADEALVAEARGWVAEHMAAHEALEKTWALPTDVDRLRRAFSLLEAEGILAREDFWCCSTCGVRAIEEEMTATNNAERPVRGFTFFHQQDTERVVQDGAMLLFFGSLAHETDENIAVAQSVVEALRAVGLKPQWDGNPDRRITMSLRWQKRRFTRAPTVQLPS